MNDDELNLPQYLLNNPKVLQKFRKAPLREGACIIKDSEGNEIKVVPITDEANYFTALKIKRGPKEIVTIDIGEDNDEERDFIDNPDGYREP